MRKDIRFCLAATALVCAIGTAHAITDTSFNYSTPKTGNFMMPPAAFTPKSTNAFDNTGMSVNTVGNCFSAPANLPHGATITAVTFWYVKQSSSLYTVTLFRRHVSNGDTEQIMASTPATTGGVRKPVKFNVTDPSLQAINNNIYHYVLQACMTDATDNFQGARITYTYSNAGD